MKIKITKCSDKNSWYNDMIGLEIEVIRKTVSMGYLVKENITVKFYVDEHDCKVVEK